MRRLLPLRALVSVVAVAAATAACAPMSDLSYRVPAGPNPPPPLGYKVECTAQPDVTFFLWPSYRTGCQQIVPAEPTYAVVRARG